MRDAHWAALLYLLNVRFLAINAIIICGSAYAASKGHPIQAYYALFTVFFLFGVFPWIQAATAMRNPMMQAPIHHTFSASGISSKFQGGNIGLDWYLVRSAREMRKHIAIWGKRGGPMLIPKNQLSQTDLVTLRSILQRRLQTRAKLESSN
jgi:hypothetical protein